MPAAGSIAASDGARLPRDDREAWLILATIAGVGEETMAGLLARHGSASTVLERAAAGRLDRTAAASADADARALPRRVLDALAAWRTSAPHILARIAQLGLWALTPLDAGYPPRLRDLDPVPPLILGRGELRLLSARRIVAVVGTRRPTPAGRWLAARVAARLVECGAVVVSGLAVGIDGVAHSTAVDRAGLTIAVIGGGHDHPGPRAHEPLRQLIVGSGGAIVSEHAPHVAPTKGTYPRRNRIIAALTEATVVVEAPLRSGALITARKAMEIGRPVYVAPGRVGEWATAGSLALLRDSPARVLAGLDELTEDLGYFAATPEPHASPTANAATAQAATAEAASAEAALALLGDAERLVADRLRRSPAGLDVLVADTNLSPSVVSSAVTLLLIRGWIQPVGPAFVAAGPLLR
jgi:DNA processing protein